MSVEGWRTVCLEKLVDVINGFAFPSDRFTEGQGLPLVRIRDLENQTTEVNYDGDYDEKYLIDKDDLLIGMDGDFLTVKWKGEKALLNQRVCKLITKNKYELNQEFLFYRIIDEINSIHRITAATTVKHLSSSDILNIQIELPKIEEQEEIAITLSTIDHAIEQTEAIIAKQQRIKTGLMQDLLTKGIDENGNIRSEETHEFKDSAIGRIPVEWDVFSLDEVADVLDPNPSHRNPIYVEHGYPFISTVEFIEPDSVEIDTPRRVAEETVLEQEKRCSFRAGSIAFSRKGTIGKTRILPSGIRFALLDSLCVINTKEGVNSNFMNQMLRSRLLGSQIQSATMGVALPQMSIGRVRELLIPVPKQEKEQIDIARQISLLNTSELQLWEQRQKICAQKTGLMQDLLTGKVRVNPLLDHPST